MLDLIVETVNGSHEPPSKTGGPNVSIRRDIFDGLFVLELANNHWGSLERGKRIVDDFAKVVRYNNVRAAIKLQFRDVDAFIHPDHRHRTDIRYIKKTLDTKLMREDFVDLAQHIRASGCIPMATPFDETSVDLCVDLGFPILKLASSDLNDWILIEKMADTRLPVVASTGGSSLKDIDDLVTFFENRNISLAVNHCVSLYPSEDGDLELNQLDFLKNRYPGVTIGFSTHEYHDWSSSMMLAYAKGARTFERHIDIDANEIPVAPYCSLPEQVDEWFRSWHKAQEMCGGSMTEKRQPPIREIEYLDALVRGVFAKRDLTAGHLLTEDDVFLAVPLLKGQLSCRELVAGEELVRDVSAKAPITIDSLGNPYSRNKKLRDRIRDRGIEAE